MEKQGKTTVNDARDLLKQANAQEKVLVVRFTGLLKQADGKSKPAIAVFATGRRAELLHDLLEELSQ